MIDAEREKHGASARGRDTGTDPLAAAFLPILLHELNNATQYLAALNALLSAVGPVAGPAEGPGARLPTHVAGLTSAARDIDQLGWLLGLAANACGADLLLERRERAGVAPLLALVRKCLRREQHDIEIPERAWPEFASQPEGTASWRIPWVVGTWLLACGRSLPVNSRLHWELGWNGARPVLRCRVPMTNELHATAARLQLAVPGLELDKRSGESTLLFAPGWLECSGETR